MGSGSAGLCPGCLSMDETKMARDMHASRKTGGKSLSHVSSLRGPICSLGHTNVRYVGSAHLPPRCPPFWVPRQKVEKGIGLEKAGVSQAL